MRARGDRPTKADRPAHRLEGTMKFYLFGIAFLVVIAIVMVAAGRPDLLVALPACAVIYFLPHYLKLRHRNRDSAE